MQCSAKPRAWRGRTGTGLHNGQELPDGGGAAPAGWLAARARWGMRMRTAGLGARDP